MVYSAATSEDIDDLGSGLDLQHDGIVLLCSFYFLTFTISTYQHFIYGFQYYNI